MAGVSQGGAHSAEINVVPLIDIVLVLLIIFMVVTPMLQKGVDVKLPVAENTIEKDERASTDIVIGVKADKTYWLETIQLSEEELKQEIMNQIAAAPFRGVLVKGDERVSYGDVRKVVLMAHEAGAKVVNIATAAKKKKGGA
jgi:biopolymer transport protein ExbD